MHLVVCPGFHAAELTEQFVSRIRAQLIGPQDTQPEWLIFPAQRYPAYSGLHVLQFLQECMAADSPSGQRDYPKGETASRRPLVFLGFSAGVVGAIAAASAWRLWGNPVTALIALDGWGVPLAGDFPIHRVSHDFFTHWSSALLGTGEDSFYADPGVEHLELWRSPDTATGWRVTADTFSRTTQTTAASFISDLISHYTHLQAV